MVSISKSSSVTSSLSSSRAIRTVTVFFFVFFGIMDANTCRICIIFSLSPFSPILFFTATSISIIRSSISPARIFSIKAALCVSSSGLLGFSSFFSPKIMSIGLLVSSFFVGHKISAIFNTACSSAFSPCANDSCFFIMRTDSSTRSRTMDSTSLPT